MKTTHYRVAAGTTACGRHVRMGRYANLQMSSDIRHLDCFQCRKAIGQAVVNAFKALSDKEPK